MSIFIGVCHCWHLPFQLDNALIMYSTTDFTAVKVKQVATRQEDGCLDVKSLEILQGLLLFPQTQWLHRGGEIESFVSQPRIFGNAFNNEILHQVPGLELSWSQSKWVSKPLFVLVQPPRFKQESPVSCLLLPVLDSKEMDLRKQRHNGHFVFDFSN